MATFVWAPLRPPAPPPPPADHHFLQHLLQLAPHLAEARVLAPLHKLLLLWKPRWVPPRIRSVAAVLTRGCCLLPPSPLLPRCCRTPAAAACSTGAFRPPIRCACMLAACVVCSADALCLMPLPPPLLHPCCPIIRLGLLFPHVLPGQVLQVARGGQLQGVRLGQGRGGGPAWAWQGSRGPGNHSAARRKTA